MTPATYKCSAYRLRQMLEKPMSINDMVNGDFTGGLARKLAARGSKAITEKRTKKPQMRFVPIERQYIIQMAPNGVHLWNTAQEFKTPTELWKVSNAFKGKHRVSILIKGKWTHIYR
jgi:hypothetical protein